MKKFFSDQITVAIDIGTTKICVLIALNDDAHTIIGIGRAPSEGLAKGVVIDIDKTVKSIKQAIREAELMADCSIESACIGISGSHIKSLNSHGMVPIKRGEIKTSDIAQVIATARAINVPEGHQILHVLPQHFIIDNQEKVLNPVGMYGVRLEAEVHIITGSIASVHNLIKCCEMAGVKVTDIILEQLASAQAVLTPDEKKLGVLMVDIGGGTSDIALFCRDAIAFTKVIPVAGNHFTHDLAVGLNTTLYEAERIKKEFGSVLWDNQYTQCVEIESISTGKRTIASSQIITILEARAQELLRLIHTEVTTHGLRKNMASGLVLTGGGSLLGGMQELAQEIFKVPVRIGNPPNIDNVILLNNPIYATGYGLLVCAQKNNDIITTHAGPLVMRIMNRMKSWMADFF